MNDSTTGDGPPTETEQPAAESELCKAEKQQRAEKCNQRHAAPVPGEPRQLFWAAETKLLFQFV